MLSFSKEDSLLLLLLGENGHSRITLIQTQGLRLSVIFLRAVFYPHPQPSSPWLTWSSPSGSQAGRLPHLSTLTFAPALKSTKSKTQPLSTSSRLANSPGQNWCQMLGWPFWIPSHSQNLALVTPYSQVFDAFTKIFLYFVMLFQYVQWKDWSKLSSTALPESLHSASVCTSK